nr:hypothetical protein CFP56_11368 [Quercus suber]
MGDMHYRRDLTVIRIYAKLACRSWMRPALSGNSPADCIAGSPSGKLIGYLAILRPVVHCCTKTTSRASRNEHVVYSHRAPWQWQTGNPPLEDTRRGSMEIRLISRGARALRKGACCDYISGA